MLRKKNFEGRSSMVLGKVIEKKWLEEGVKIFYSLTVKEE
jgi:hypothetical protein